MLIPVAGFLIDKEVPMKATLQLASLLFCLMMLAACNLLGTAPEQPEKPSQPKEPPAAEPAKPNYDELWKGKGYYFAWEKPIPEGLTFSGSAYGCNIDFLKVNATISGKVWEDTDLNASGSSPNDLMLIPLSDMPLRTYSSRLILEGPLTSPKTTCTARFTLDIVFELNLETKEAWLRDAKITEGTMECPTESGTISVPYPVPFSQLPRDFQLDFQVVEAVDCAEIK
jgi:hypothetical protein